MQMDPGLDTGPMLLRGHVPIGPRATTPELHDALAALGAALIVDALAVPRTPVPAARSRRNLRPEADAGRRAPWTGRAPPQPSTVRCVP